MVVAMVVVVVTMGGIIIMGRGVYVLVVMAGCPRRCATSW
jgi:hypothetical protein